MNNLIKSKNGQDIIFNNTKAKLFAHFDAVKSIPIRYRSLIKHRSITHILFGGIPHSRTLATLSSHTQYI